MKEVTLLVSKIIDVNIFHFFAVEINAVWQSVHNNKTTNFFVFLQDYKNNGVHRWRYDLLNCVVPTFTNIEELHSHCRKNNVMIQQITDIIYPGWIIDPWSFVDYTPNDVYMAFALTVKQSLGITQTHGTYATLVTRKKSRVLYDAQSKVCFENIFADYCQAHDIPHKIVCFDDVSLKEQADTLADTKVMLSCHGAGNTNVFLLPDNGHLMEINFRKHWYCDPVCDPHFSGTLSSTCQCKGQLTWRPYFHKADYHNLAKFFGKQYTELDIESVDGFLDRNPINVRKVYIDANCILQKMSAIMETNS